MANAEVSSPPPVPQGSKRPPNTVAAPPNTIGVESPNESASDGQEEPREEDCDVARSISENKIPLPAGSDFLLEGKAVFGEDSSFEKETVREEPMLDSHVPKLETEQEERDLPAVKLDRSTPEQSNGEYQVAKSGSERKRKSHDGSKNIESLFERPDRRLTRSNSRIISKGMDHVQKVAKRLTRSQKSSPVDYLGNDVDILGLERALKRLSRTGSKRVLQEPAIDEGHPNSPPEKASDCIISVLPDLDGSSDVVNTGLTIIEEIMDTIQEDETQPLCVELPIQELINLDAPSDELEKESVSTEQDEAIKETKETNGVCAKEEPILLLEFIRDDPVHENKIEEQTIVVPMEVCPTAVDVSCDTNTLENPKLEMPLRRLTRSALKNAQMEVTGFSCLGSDMDELIPKNENVEEQEAVVAMEQVQVQTDRSIDVDKMDKPVSYTPSKRLTRSALKNAQMDVTPFLGFRSTIDEPRPETQNAEKVEVASVTMDDSSDTNTNKLEKSEFETPSKRLTRSALKNAQMATNDLELPPRRFTRSLLKFNASCNEEDGAGDSVNVSELERPSKKVSRSSQKGNKSERGPMVSGGCKKFDLIKPPSNARELLATGLLEGLDVKYIIPHSKKPVLKGVIKGGNILCFCSTCNGFRSVSAYNFEVHAGSTKKHPSDFIFLENGNTLRDVLRICSSARIDDLEAALKNEVGPIPKKNLRACLKCGSLLTSDVHKFLLCDSCCEANQPPPPCNSTLSMIQSPVTPHRPLIPGPSQSSVEMPSKNLSSSTSVLSPSTKKTNTNGRLTRKNTALHKLVFMGDILPEGTEVAYYVGGKRLLDGYIKDGAIFCHCCMAVVSPSQFEAHAGQASRRKPYNNIYTSNGVSLHELSVSLSKHKMISLGETDDLCSICSDSGDLIVCDFCPRAFHKDCVGLTEVPEGDWYCQFCVSLHRRDSCVASNDNARAAGRVEGVDPIEQIFKRCIRIVSISETDLGGCTICKLHDFSQSGFDDRTVILCDQCQREYHVGCLRECNMANLKELPEGEWFCSPDCNRMHGALKEVILGGPQSLASSDIELIRRKTEAKDSSDNENEEIVDFDNIRWRLLSGASAQELEAQLLSGAVSIFHESFDPIIDAKTKKDLIPAMVNGMSIEGHQDYSGMYCAVLTIGSKVVSAGLLRVFGTDAAELPLVATSRDLQGLGYFQALFGCMEKMLIELRVKHFLLPAAEEAESIWTRKFGFTRISSDQVDEYLKGAHLTAFRGTSSLHRPLFIS